MAMYNLKNKMLAVNGEENNSDKFIIYMYMHVNEFMNIHGNTYTTLFMVHGGFCLCRQNPELFTQINFLFQSCARPYVQKV